MDTKTDSIRKRVLAVFAALLLFAVCLLPLIGCSKTEKTYTVRFDSNGGSHVASVTVRAGHKVPRPEDPTKSGKTFVAWFANKDLTSLWDFDTNIVNKDRTLHAGWRDASDPSAPIDPPVDDPDDVDDGDGGNGDGGNGGDGENGDDSTVDPTQPTATVTFNVGLEARMDGLSNPPAKTVNVGATVTAPSVTRTGYSLSGWKVENGSTKWDFSSPVQKNMTLFADWSTGGSSGGVDENYTPTRNDSNVAYLHYLRGDNMYTGWHVWAWGSVTQNWYEPIATDKSGAIFAFNINSGVTSFNFLVAKGKWEMKDGEADNVYTLANAQKIGSSYHWYVRSGYVANGSNRFKAGAGSVGGGGANAVTEALRESTTNIDRSFAKNLAVQPTVSGWDETGIGYQIFVASFCDSDGNGTGDIRGIINKLDYLESLNVDVLWLTPIQSSDSSHGYDCYDYYAIDPKFGSNADYRELVYKVHQKNMKIVMDLVVNHTSTKNEWFLKSKRAVVETVTYQDGTSEEVHYRDMYRWSRNSGKWGDRTRDGGGNWYYYSSFGSSMPEINYDYQPARKMMTDVAMYWMSYGLDGFRMDAIKHMFMWDESVNQSGDDHGGIGDNGYDYNSTKNVEFFKEFNYRLKTKFPGCFLLGEQLSGNVNDVSKFYAGMDSLFDFNTYYDLPGKISSGNASNAATAFNNNAASYANKRGDRPINSMISSNHDINRLYHQIGGGDLAKTKLYFSVLMTLPGITWIYYGDEIGMIGQKTNNDDTPLRQPMKWTSSWENGCTSIPDIRDMHINNSVASVAEQNNNPSSLLSYVKSLGALRNSYPQLISGQAACQEYNGMLKITVTKTGSNTLTVYHNFSSSPKSVSGGTAVFGSTSIPAYGTAVFV